MHILVISRSYPNPINKSSGNFVKNQVEALAENDIKIGVLGVYNVSVFEYLKVKNFKKLGYYSDNKSNLNVFGYLYPVLPKFHLLNYRIKFLIGKKLLKKYISKYGKPDLIHFHTFESGSLGLWAKGKFKIPYVVTEHTSSFSLKTALKWHYKLAKKVYDGSQINIAVSKSSTKFLNEMFSSEFIYLPNFVDTSHFKLKQTGENSIKKFINVAYLNKNKNQSLLIDAFYNAFHDNNEFELSIVGSGSEKENLQKQIKELNIKNIKLLGFIAQNELAELLQNSEYFVLSSNVETFGVVIIEAMSCGLPVVSTKCGGPESIITDNKLGILCQKNNVDELSQALIKLSQNKYDTQFIRNYAIENFSYKSLSDKLINIYSEIIKN